MDAETAFEDILHLRLSAEQRLQVTAPLHSRKRKPHVSPPSAWAQAHVSAGNL